jgi:hypothetical protein
MKNQILTVFVDDPPEVFELIGHFLGVVSEYMPKFVKQTIEFYQKLGAGNPKSPISFCFDGLETADSQYKILCQKIKNIRAERKKKQKKRGEKEKCQQVLLGDEEIIVLAI